MSVCKSACDPAADGRGTRAIGYGLLSVMAA